MTLGRCPLVLTLPALALIGSACGGGGGGASAGAGGSSAAGTAGAISGGPGSAATAGSGLAGTTGSSGTTGLAGMTGLAGTPGSAGTIGYGGTAGIGGAASPGGMTSAGGSSATGGNGAGGSSATGGNAGSGAAGTAGASGSLSSLPLKNPPVGSAGCGRPTMVTSGKKTIMSGGMQRSYIIDIPTNYDMSKPYRFFYTSHWISSTAEAVQQQNFYFLKPLANAANEPAIFLAPQALPGNPSGTWDTQKDTDQVLFDDILAFVKANLCIDTTRVFATGFSFGGMMTYSLSVNHQKDIRAAVGIAPANYHIYVPTKTHQPIAWMQTTGVNDTTCPWVNGMSTTEGAKYIAIEHGTDNGCMVPSDIPTWTSGPHLCVDFQGCMIGAPTKVCTFNGPHTNINSDPGSNANWIPTESWKFFTQF